MRRQRARECKAVLIAGLLLCVLNAYAWGEEIRMAPVVLEGRSCGIEIDAGLQLKVTRNGQHLWASSQSQPPEMLVRRGKGKPRALLLSSAAKVSIRRSGTPARKANISLSNYLGTDVAIRLSFALDAATDKLTIEVSQSGGTDSVVSIDHLYRFEKPVEHAGYLVVPRGSGYIIPADCQDAFPHKEDPEATWVGASWSMPLFGMTSDSASLSAIVDTWWDSQVRVEHEPGKWSALDFSWASSLGKLSYPRRLILRLGKDMDYVAMAKWYREYMKDHKLLRTLEEKSKKTPAIRQNVKNVLYRWTTWNSTGGPGVLDDIKLMREMGLGVTLFFPKWTSLGYDPATGELRKHPDGSFGEAGWQGYLLDDPVPGGWQTLVGLADEARKLGALVQGMFVMRWNFKEAPGYSADRFAHDEDGKMIGRLDLAQNYSTCDDDKRYIPAIENATRHGLKFDALYFDGYSAHDGLPQDFTPAHPMTRRQKFEMQLNVFRETRRRGMMPGAELRRSWSAADCDWFFYTDWSGDRLANVPSANVHKPVGEPVPLCQLAFGDCCISGFSGNACGPAYNWFPGRTPRLYELMYASQPCYNWLLPDTSKVPIANWNDDLTRRRFDWLRKWSAFYQAVAMSEMVSHKFLSPDRKMQQVEFAGGVCAQFDMMRDRYRVIGVHGFSGDWEAAPEI